MIRNNINEDDRDRSVVTAKGQAKVEDRDRSPEFELDPSMAEALRDFRMSVHAWGESVYDRPRRALAAAPRRRVWRLAAGWALGCALIAGGLSGGLYDVQHRKELTRIAAIQRAEQQRQHRLASEEQARLEEEDLLAKVDSDVAREVPAAMEPLAQLMAGEDVK